MAEGHAKLSLRHEASVYDALAAIKLYEENMTLHSGYSLLIQNEGSTENDEVVSIHSSEKRGLCLMKCPGKMLQNLSYFWKMKTYVFFPFFIS